jgi:hypothetical protein
MAVVGITVFVAANLGGTILIVTTPGYPNEVTDHSQTVAGLLVTLVGTGLGAALAVPGFIKMGKSSDEENQATEYYRDAKGAAFPLPAALRPREAIRVSLLTLSF